MVVTEAQKRELAKILTEHVPEYALRVSITQETALGDLDVSGPPEEAWALILDTAERRGRMRALLANASRLSPFDATLERLAQTAAVGHLDVTDHRIPQKSPPFPWKVFVYGAGGALVIVAVTILGANLVNSLPWPEKPEAGDGDVPEVEVRSSLKAPPRPAPRPAPTVEPEPEPEPESVDLPKASSGKYIRIPEPAPEEAPPPSGGADVVPEPQPVSSE